MFSLNFETLLQTRKYATTKLFSRLSHHCLLNLSFAECDELHPCQGLGEHAHFRSFGMAFLTLFRIATGDNWNGIMKDTLREECEDGDDCLRNCCVSPYFAPLFFVVFVLMAQFVLVNVVVAVLMKHLEESHKQVKQNYTHLGIFLNWKRKIVLKKLRNAAMGAIIILLLFIIVRFFFILFTFFFFMLNVR